MSKISKQKAKDRRCFKLINVEPPKETEKVTCPQCEFVQYKKDYCSLCGHDLR